MFASLLCCLGKVPPAYDDVTGDTYTQRPAVSKDVDSESRDSKNSQSSLEATVADCRAQQLRPSSETATNKKTKVVNQSQKLPAPQQRESHSHAADTHKSPRLPTKECPKDKDISIISGQTSPTNNCEQRVQPYRSSTESSSIPSIAVTSMGGQSIDEEDDDFEELFSKRHPNQMLGSRSSLADSRESLYSVYSDAGDDNSARISVTGEIMFYMTYDNRSSTLEVHVKQCRDLAPVDVKHNRSDPYVKTYLLPDKTRNSKRKTRIKKHTLNPVFDEILKYQVSSADLVSRSLWLTVFNNDRLGRNNFLGEVTIPLDYYRFDENRPQWFTLQERTSSQDPVMFYQGDLLLALKYIPADMVEAAPSRKKPKHLNKKNKDKEKPESALGELHVLVKEAQNLTAMRAASGSNPFCKGYLLPDTSHSSKQKTPVIRKTTNPEWQHMLVFGGVDETQLHEYGLELTVWDHDKLSSNDFLGGVRLNLGLGTHQGKPVSWMDARGEEIEAWQCMIDQPNEWIDVQLPLRASMGKRNVQK